MLSTARTSLPRMVAWPNFIMQYVSHYRFKFAGASMQIGNRETTVPEWRRYLQRAWHAVPLR